MNIVIADDERLALSSLRSMLHELEYPVRLVGEARNGEELLTLLKTTTPDVIFVDIRMPALSGLEALKIAKPSLPHTHWVVVSGFSEFSYAQEAIRYGVSDFLLKPVDPTNLHACLQKIDENHREKQQLQNYAFEHWASVQLYINPPDENNPKRNEAYKDYCFIAGLLYNDSTESEDRASADRMQFAARMNRTLHQNVSDKSFRSGVVHSVGEHLICIWGWSAGDDNLNRMFQYEWEKAWTLAVGESAGCCKCTMLRTDLTTSFAALSAELNMLEELSALRIYNRAQSILGVQDLSFDHRSAPRRLFGQLLLQLARHYRSGNYTNYINALNELKRGNFGDVERDRPRMQAVRSFIESQFGIVLSDNQSLSQWLQGLQGKADQLLNSNEQTIGMTAENIALRIKEYVDQNYMKDILLTALAMEYNVTPNYLSTVFRKKTGTTFVKYLTEVRLHKAKELLITKPEMKVHDVAATVGYSSQRHFTNLFHDFFHCYPSEVRRRT